MFCNHQCHRPKLVGGVSCICPPICAAGREKATRRRRRAGAALASTGAKGGQPCGRAPSRGVIFCLAALARSRGVSACPAVSCCRRVDLLANVDGGEKTSNLETFSIDEVLRVPSPLSILCRRGPAIDSNHRELRRERRVYRKVAEPPKASCSKTIEHGTLSTFLFEIGVVARETVTWGGQVAKNSQYRVPNRTKHYHCFW